MEHPADLDPRRCACLGFYEEMGLPKKTVDLVPTNITYDIDLVDGLANVNICQTFTNRTDKFLELQYTFSISPNACLHKFAAVFAKKRMDGAVKEKEEARKEFKEAVQQGKQAALGEVEAESKDIFRLQIGNIDPGESVTIELSYSEELTLTMNTFYQFTLPTKLNPRFFSTMPLPNYLNAFRARNKQVKADFSWDFKLKLTTSRKVTAYQTTSQTLAVEGKNDAATEHCFTLAPGQTLTRDFVFMYTTEYFEQPSYSLGRTDAGTSVMVSFIPKFCQLNLDDAKRAALK